MAHYAKVLDGKVTNVIVADQEFFTTFVDTEPGEWIQTSYNTHGGVHSLGGTPLRKNYAGIGYSYDRTKDAFIPPKPYSSWILDDTTCQWKSPIDMPTDELASGKCYYWDEAAHQADNSTGWKVGNVTQQKHALSW